MLVRQPYMSEMPRLIVYEWGVHLIDVLRMLLGPVRTVSARMGRRSPLVKGEDWAAVLLGFDGGRTGLVDISWSTPVPDDRRLSRGCVDPFVLEGDAVVVELDPFRDDALVLTRPGGRQEVTPARGTRTRAEAYQDSYAAAQGHFVHSLRSGSVAETEASDNLNALRAAFAAYEAADRGTTVEVPS
jgi:predicted dehydrogenase